MERRLNILRLAMWNLFQNCGFSMSGAVAFTFLLSLFPFCIFLGALAATLGGRELAAYAVAQLFQAVPEPVAKVLAPEIERAMGRSQYGLLTVGAAARGFRASLPLLLGELAGYLIVVVPLATIAGSLLEGRPALAIALRLAAALWVLFLAIRLWRVSAVQKSPDSASPVTIGQVFVTTLLNPKAPIIGLVIMPHGPRAPR